jgi:hypothetical protein
VYIAAVSETRGDDERERSGTVARPDPSAPSAPNIEPRSPFRALLSAAIEHEDAAVGLSCAYAELPVDDRARLLDAVIEDARAEGIDVRLLLARLCGVERDEGLSDRILAALGVDRTALIAAQAATAHAPDARGAGAEVWLCGDASSGAAMLVRPLEGSSHDVLGLRWRAARGLELTLREQVRREGLSAFAERLQGPRGPASAQLEPSPTEFASDVLAGALWQHVRARGALPEVLAEFADMIGPRASF